MDKNTIERESSVSRQLQQLIPVSDLSDEYSKHPYVTQFDTYDKIIAEDLTQEPIYANDVYFKQNTIITSPKGTTFRESVPTSNLTEYNKIKVDIDKDGHLFFFDWTDKNSRIHLRHSAGTYFTINDDGEYTFKSISNYNKIVKGNDFSIINYNQYKVVKEDRITMVKGNEYKSIGKNQSLTTGYDLKTFVNNNEYKKIGNDRITRIERNEVLYVSGLKEQVVIGSYTVESKDIIAFRSADTIVFDSPNIVYNSTGSVVDEIGGSKTITAGKLNLSGVEGLNLSTLGNHSTSITGYSEEVISGVSTSTISEYSKRINVSMGGYYLKTNSGTIKLQSVLPLNVSISNSLGSMVIDTSGSIDFTSPQSDISIDSNGEVTINGSLGKLLVGLSFLELDHDTLIKLGSGATNEFAVLGIKLITWINAHTHGTGVGPSSPPIIPATPIDFLSQLVTIE